MLLNLRQREPVQHHVYRSVGTISSHQQKDLHRREQETRPETRFENMLWNVELERCSSPSMLPEQFAISTDQEVNCKNKQSLNRDLKALTMLGSRGMLEVPSRSCIREWVDVPGFYALGLHLVTGAPRPSSDSCMNRQWPVASAIFSDQKSEQYQAIPHRQKRHSSLGIFGLWSCPSVYVSLSVFRCIRFVHFFETLITRRHNSLVESSRIFN